MASPRLPQALGRPDDQPVREPDLGARAADRSHRRARRERVPGRACSGRSSSCRSCCSRCRPASGSTGSPASDTRHRRPGTRGGARLGARRLRLRRAHHLAAVRRRLRGGHADGVLRRRVPVVSAVARSPRSSSLKATRSSSSARPPRSSVGRRRQAASSRCSRRRGPCSRTRSASSARRSSCSASASRRKSWSRRWLRRSQGMRRRGLGGPAVRMEGPAAAGADREHGDLQLLRQRRVRRLPGLRRALARPLPGGDRRRSSRWGTSAGSPVHSSQAGCPRRLGVGMTIIALGRCGRSGA